MPWSYLASVAVYTFGAITFCVLAVSYLTQRRTHGFGPFPAFTLLCAVAFVSNLVSQVGRLESAPFALIGNLPAGLLPPLMLHVVWTAGPRWRRWALGVFYVAGATVALARGLNEIGVIAIGAGEALSIAPAVFMAVAAATAISVGRPHRRAMFALLTLMLVFAAANLVSSEPLVRQAPDYLLLAFFGVTLYYRERLVFIDLLVKRGVFFGLGLAVLAVGFAIVIRPEYGVGLMLVLWLAAPWVYDRIAGAIDSAWLRRPYSPIEAERRFIREVQLATTEEELAQCARRSLRDIFRTEAEVHFESAVEQMIVLAPRPDGIPFLSDDLRLLESLRSALAMVLENVRFREREQQLRLLASRAELKALRAQINPHFLFNALSVIAGLVQYEPELAAETVEQLAQVFRYALRKSENEWTTLGEEVEFVRAYLRIEQARFGERLKVEFDVDAAAARIPIPAMSIQPLVENAIKHGVSSLQHGGVIRLRAAVENESLNIGVCDNGPGFPSGFSLDDSGQGHALRNIAERLRGYYGESARLSFTSGPKGTRVELTLPQHATVGGGV